MTTIPRFAALALAAGLLAGTASAEAREFRLKDLRFAEMTEEVTLVCDFKNVEGKPLGLILRAKDGIAAMSGGPDVEDGDVSFIDDGPDGLSFHDRREPGLIGHVTRSGRATLDVIRADKAKTFAGKCSISRRMVRKDDE